MKQQEFLYKKVIRYVTDLIKQHSLEPNYKLPSEKQLELKLGVSNITVKHALNKLEADGLVIRYQGKGTFINTMISQSELDFPLYNIIVCLISLNSHFIQEILLGISDSCREKGMNFFCYQSYNNLKSETKLIRTLKNLNYDGMIIYPSDGNYYNKDLIKLCMDDYPIVALDRDVRGINISFVTSDHYHLTFNAVTRLIDAGYKRIAIILPLSQDISTAGDRYRGYVDAHIQKKMQINKDYILDRYISSTRTDFIKSITYPLDGAEIDKWAADYTNFLEEKPEVDAVITINGISFLSLLKAVQEINKKTKRSVKILTYDNDFDDIAPIVDVPFESIQQNGYKIGKTAANQLYNLITGSTKHKKIVIE